MNFIIRFCTLLLVAIAAAPAFSAEPKAPFFGVVSHFLHNKYIYKDKDDSWLTTRTSPLLTDLGTQWVTEQIYALTNKTGGLVDDGTLNAADQAKVMGRRRLVDQWLSVHDQKRRKVLLTILAASPKAKNFEAINRDFTQWIVELVRKHPSIVAVQLHNEPNLRSFWTGSPQDYVEVYRPIAREIKRNNPNVEIVVGAASSLSWDKGRDWLRVALKAGLLDFADGVSTHPYNRKMPPERDPHFTGATRPDDVQLLQAIKAFWDEVQTYNRGGRALKLYFTELGYSSAPNGIAGIGDETLQAKYLTRLMALYVDSRVRQKVPLEAVFWYDLKSDGNKPAEQEDNFGLTSFDLQRKKPAFLAYKNAIAAIGDLSTLGGFVSGAPQTDGNIIQLGWQRAASKQYLIPFWATQTPGDLLIKLANSQMRDAKKATVVDLMSGQRRSVAITDGSVKVQATDYAQILILE